LQRNNIFDDLSEMFHHHPWVTVTSTLTDQSTGIHYVQDDLFMTVSVDLAGFKKTDVTLTYDGQQVNVLTPNNGVTRVFKSFLLSDEYDPTTGSATMEDGLLKVAFQKVEKEPKRSNTIPIK